MSADADRIEEWAQAIKSFLESHASARLLDRDLEMVRKALREVSNADQIARLTSELAEAREERNIAEADVCKLITERDAAQLNARSMAHAADAEKRDRIEMRRLLDAERSAHERTQAELAKAHQARASYSAQARDALRERDDALNERDAAQADLADTRAQLAKVRHYRDEMIAIANAPAIECGHGRQTLVCKYPVCIEVRRLRAIAARVPLLEAVAKAANPVVEAAQALIVAMCQDDSDAEQTEHVGRLARALPVFYEARQRLAALDEKGGAGTAGRTLAARLPLLEAVANDAREMERRATGKALLPTPEQWQQLTKDLAALDEKGGAGTAGRTLAARLPLLEGAVTAMKNHRAVEIAVLESRGQWDNSETGKAVDDALAALDEKGGAA